MKVIISDIINDIIGEVTGDDENEVKFLFDKTGEVILCLSTQDLPRMPRHPLKPMHSFRDLEATMLNIVKSNIYLSFVNTELHVTFTLNKYNIFSILGRFLRFVLMDICLTLVFTH